MFSKLRTRIRHLHWKGTTALLPELRFIDDYEEFVLVLNQAQHKTPLGKYQHFYLTTMVVFFNTVFLRNGGILTPLIHRLVIAGNPNAIELIQPVLAGEAMFWALFLGHFWHRIWRRPVRRALREMLLRKGHLLCMGCGYDLQGQTDPRCPECGEEFCSIFVQPHDASNTEAQVPDS